MTSILRLPDKRQKANIFFRILTREIVPCTVAKTSKCMTILIIIRILI